MAINYYEELDIDPKISTEEINNYLIILEKKISHSLKPKDLLKIPIIHEAKIIFSSEDSRLKYDETINVIPFSDSTVNNFNVIYEKAKKYYLSSRFPLALAVFQEASADKSDWTISAHILESLVHAELGLQDSLNIIDRVIARESDSPIYYFIRFHIYLKLVNNSTNNSNLASYANLELDLYQVLSDKNNFLDISVPEGFDESIFNIGDCYGLYAFYYHMAYQNYSVAYDLAMKAINHNEIYGWGLIELNEIEKVKNFEAELAAKNEISNTLYTLKSNLSSLSSSRSEIESKILKNKEKSQKLYWLYFAILTAYQLCAAYIFEYSSYNTPERVLGTYSFFSFFLLLAAVTSFYIGSFITKTVEVVSAARSMLLSCACMVLLFYLFGVVSYGVGMSYLVGLSINLSIVYIVSLVCLIAAYLSQGVRPREEIEEITKKINNLYMKIDEIEN